MVGEPSAVAAAASAWGPIPEDAELPLQTAAEATFENAYR